MAISKFDGCRLESSEWLLENGIDGLTNLEALGMEGKLHLVQWAMLSPTKWAKHFEVLKRAETANLNAADSGTRRVWEEVWVSRVCEPFENFIAKVEAMKKLKEETKLEIIE